MNYKLNTEIYCVGDIHGQPQGLEYVIESEGIKNASFILLGDVGLGFGGNHIGPCTRLEKIAVATDNTFYIFRGNHDNPASFTEHKQEIMEKCPHVHVLEDFDVIETRDGKRALVIGGSVSIDRCYRVEGKNWWRGELIDYDGLSALLKDNKEHYDYVFAHTGPTPPELVGGSPFFNSMIAQDKYVKDAVEKEQEYVLEALRTLKPSRWINGHFHIGRSFNVDGTEVTALDIDDVLSV